ncbi:MAG TPA: hypothetical protein DD400_01940 [Rhodospirillaceae bacterium]|nr:hypothetical protein [Rhodospirillaceae bacterium]
MSLLNEKFVDLGQPRRIWAIAAINGERERLATLHDHIATRFSVCDRLVYLGNYIGAGAFDNLSVIEELLAFRAALLSKSGVETSDIVHLRGPSEEAWQRLLRLQFAPAPTQALERYLDFGAEAYLRLYGVSLNDTKSMARAGSVAITRWTNQLRVLQRQAAGHEPFVCSFRRAAITSYEENNTLLIPAGYDGRRPLEEQGDNLWFSGRPFSAPDKNQSIARVVRGFDPMRGGIRTESAAVTLDGGCGQGGPLTCACFDGKSQILEIITIGGKGAIESSRFENVPRPDLPTAESTPKNTPAQQPMLWSEKASGAA